MACPLPINKGWRMGSWAWCLLGAGVVKKKERDNNYSSTWEGRTRKKEKGRGCNNLISFPENVYADWAIHSI
jgi:hypothetical protein